MTNDVIENIQNNFDNLFPAEKKVASYILENTSEVINLNVSELAQKSKTSDATVVRAIKHLGYDGHYQMRLLLSKDIGKFEVKNENESTLNSVQKFFSLESERITRLSETIDFEELIEISKVILKAKTTHVIAVGNTVPVSFDLGFRLQRAGISCEYSMLFEQFINNINLGSKEDCVIAISRSGASTQVIRGVELAKKKKMKVIVITGELNKTLISNADYVIKINEMKSQISTIYKPDSHLLELAINDVLVYVIQTLQKIKDIKTKDLDFRDNIGILLSEFKQ